MKLKFENVFVIFGLSFICLSQVHARPVDEAQEFDQIKEISVYPVEASVIDEELIESLKVSSIDEEGETPPKPDAIEKAGKIIQLGKDLVALGEDVYKLVTKGRPNLSTTYAPISVVPKVDGQPADVMSLEGWSEPQKQTYEVVYTNYYNMNVVTFRFSVIFSANGSYNGKGAYITAAQIVPEMAHALFAYDFSATLKLGGIQNLGTRENPIAGATLIMEHSVNTLVKASMMTTTIFITGKGKIKQF